MSNLKALSVGYLGLIIGLFVGIVLTVALYRVQIAKLQERIDHQKTTDVIIALEPISQGSDFAFGSIGRRRWPADAVPSDIIT